MTVLQERITSLSAAHPETLLTQWTLAETWLAAGKECQSTRWFQGCGGEGGSTLPQLKQGHLLVASHTEALEFVGQAVGGLVQFLVAYVSIPYHHGHGPRLSLGHSKQPSSQARRKGKARPSNHAIAKHGAADNRNQWSGLRYVRAAQAAMVAGLCCTPHPDLACWLGSKRVAHAECFTPLVLPICGLRQYCCLVVEGSVILLHLC